jgi:hypothetical protein
MRGAPGLQAISGQLMEGARMEASAIEPAGDVGCFEPEQPDALPTSDGAMP